MAVRREETAKTHNFSNLANRGAVGVNPDAINTFKSLGDSLLVLERAFERKQVNNGCSEQAKYVCL
jgi:hypothetical protein